MRVRPPIHELCRIAEGAGQVVLRHYHRPVHVSAKADKSPLSEADCASHEYLVDALGRLTPGWSVISEESGDERRVAWTPSEGYWLVDPLDGTKEFLKGTDQFTVNIALIECGRPVLGVVVAPALALTYYATPAIGAWQKRGAGAPAPIRTRPADRTRLAIVASKDHVGPQVSRLLGCVPGAEVTNVGSSLKFCLIADGTADLYLRDLPTMEWDTAAAQCIVEAAGGRVCELGGQPLGYGKKDFKNPAIVAVGDSRLRWEELVSSIPA